MAQVTWSPPWIADSFFATNNPQICTIRTVRIEQDSKGRNETVLELVSESFHVQMSVFGQNLKRLIDAFGDETDDWHGKTVHVESYVEGKQRRRRILID